MNTTLNNIKKNSDENGEARFEFGKNWSNFLKVINEQRIVDAQTSLLNMLSKENLNGITFLDVGCEAVFFRLQQYV